MEEHSVMIRNTKGYYTVEAAVFLPVFLLAVLTLGYFVKAAGVQSDVIHAAADEVFYHCSGYTALGELKLNTPREWFEVLGKLMMTLRKAQEFLLDEERMTLELTTIFFHRKQRNVKIAFFPCASEGTGKKICRLIQKIQKEADQETAEYLQRLHQNIVRDNLDLAAMTRLTANLRREIIQCS